MFKKQYIAFYFAFLLLLGMCSSCSCSWHLKKVAQKCNVTNLQDSVTIHDTIRVDKVTYDTLFSSKPGDTITIEKDRLKIKYVRFPGDSVYIKGECDTVFVARIIKKPYTKTVINNELSWFQKFRMHLGDIALFFTLILIIYGAWQLTRK